MRALDDFAADARDAGLRLRVDAEHLERISRLARESLFHIPLLAICILVVARGHRRKLETADLAAWTGATLGKHFSGIEAVHRKLEWSLHHRKRCADALIFLENIQLVQVEATPQRTVRCSVKGLDFLRRLQAGGDSGPDEIGVLTRGLDRAYRAVAERGLDLL